MQPQACGRAAQPLASLFFNFQQERAEMDEHSSLCSLPCSLALPRARYAKGVWREERGSWENSGGRVCILGAWGDCSIVKSLWLFDFVTMGWGTASFLCFLQYHCRLATSFFPRSYTNLLLVKSQSLSCGAVVHLTTVNTHINKRGPSGVISVTHQHLTLTQAVEQAERRVWHDCLDFRPRCCGH